MVGAELPRCLVGEPRMRAHSIVIALPRGQYGAGLGKRGEHCLVEALNYGAQVTGAHLTRHRHCSCVSRPRIHNGNQLTAARTLADLGIRESRRRSPYRAPILHRLENTSMIQVSEKKHHGHAQRAVRERIPAALQAAGIELLAEGGSFGARVGSAITMMQYVQLVHLTERRSSLQTQTVLPI